MFMFIKILLSIIKVILLLAAAIIFDCRIADTRQMKPRDVKFVSANVHPYSAECFARLGLSQMNMDVIFASALNRARYGTLAWRFFFVRKVQHRGWGAVIALNERRH